MPLPLSAGMATGRYEGVLQYLLLLYATAYDQVVHDAAIRVGYLCLDRAGLVGELTHFSWRFGDIACFAQFRS